MVETKIMKVFYDANCLPYKDKERQVHFPIVGNSFSGASGTTEIRFYVDQIGDLDLTWVANAKLPNGKTGSKVLSTSGNDDDGAYVSLSLTQWFTQLKGDLYISLQGYQGGINYTYDDETDLYNISGTPIIQATGVIKINIAFSSPFNGVAELSVEDYQSLLALIADSNAKGFTVVYDIYEEDLSNYGVGHLFYDKESAEVYAKTNTSPYYERYYDFLFDYVPYIGRFISTSNLNDLYTMASEYNNKAFIFQYYGSTNSGYYIGYITSQGSNRGFSFISLFNYALAFYGNNVANTTTLSTIFDTNSSYKKTYMDLESAQTITGKKTFNNIRLWEGELGDGDFTFETNQDYLKFEDRYGNTIDIYREDLTIDFNTTFDEIVNFEEDVYANANFQVEGYAIFRDQVEIDSTLYVDSDITTDGDIYTHNIYPQGNLNDDIGDATRSYRRVYTGQVYFTEDTYLFDDGGDLTFAVDGSEYAIATIDYVNSVVSSVYKPQGTKTVAELNALTPTSSYNGYVYNVSNSGTLSNGSISVNAGDNVVIIWDNDSWSWDVLAGTVDLSNYYTKSQTDSLLNGYVQTSRTIADINLESNISASALTDALVFATNSDIDALFE